MVLLHTKNVSSFTGITSDNRTTSHGSLESVNQYERKLVLARPRLAGTSNHQSCNNLMVETYMTRTVSSGRSNSVKDLRDIFDHNSVTFKVQKSTSGQLLNTTPSLHNNKVRNGYGDSPATSSTANASFDMASTRSPPVHSLSWDRLSPEVAVMQKRLADFRDKLRNQETRHSQERLAWQGQTMELQRLRKERDRLLEDQTNQRRQLQGTHTIAQAVMVENQELRTTCTQLQPEVTWKMGVDWERKLDQLCHESSSQDKKIGDLQSQLEEANEQLLRETKVNTEFVIQLHETAGELRRQSSQKDLHIGILVAQLDEKDQQLQLESDLNTEVLATLRANEASLRHQTNQKDLTIERLMVELNESRRKLQFADDVSSNNGRIDEKWINKVHDTQEELRKELKKAKFNNLKILTAVREKLLKERATIKREREELQTLKRSVVKESVQSIAVMSGLRGLVKKMQQKMVILEQEKLDLKSLLEQQS